jgi:hypothetical protein
MYAWMRGCVGEWVRVRVRVRACVFVCLRVQDSRKDRIA